MLLMQPGSGQKAVLREHLQCICLSRPFPGPYIHASALLRAWSARMLVSRRLCCLCCLSRCRGAFRCTSKLSSMVVKQVATGHGPAV